MTQDRPHHDHDDPQAGNRPRAPHVRGENAAGPTSEPSMVGFTTGPATHWFADPDDAHLVRDGGRSDHPGAAIALGAAALLVIALAVLAVLLLS